MSLPEFVTKQNAQSGVWHVFRKEERDGAVFYHTPMCGKKFGVYKAFFSHDDPENIWAVKIDAEFKPEDMHTRHLCKRCQESYVAAQVRDFRGEMNESLW